MVKTIFSVRENAGPSKVLVRCGVIIYITSRKSPTVVGESLVHVQGLFPKDQRVISSYMIFELPDFFSKARIDTTHTFLLCANIWARFVW